MDVFVYVFITLISLYTFSWICGVIYLIHPFKCLAWFYHDVMGWHKPVADFVIRRLCKIAKGTGSHLIDILRRKTC